MNSKLWLFPVFLLGNSILNAQTPRAATQPTYSLLLQAVGKWEVSICSEYYMNSDRYGNLQQERCSVQEEYVLDLNRDRTFVFSRPVRTFEGEATEVFSRGRWGFYLDEGHQLPFLCLQPVGQPLICEMLVMQTANGRPWPIVPNSIYISMGDVFSGYRYGYRESVRVPQVAPYVEPVVEERPERVSSPPACYPDSLRAAGIEGQVLLEVVIDTTGHAEPGSIRVISSTHPSFEGPAREVVQRSLYSPGRIQGKAVRVRVQIPINFTPPRRQ